MNLISSKLKPKKNKTNFLFFIVFTISSLLFCLSILSCTHLREDSVMSMPPPPPLKKETKETLQKNRSSSEMSPRSRLMILPFLDASDKRPPELAEEARKYFMKTLINTERVLCVDASEIKVDIPPHLNKKEYTIETLSPKIHALGIPAFLEGKILDISVHKKSDSVGIIRQLKTKFDVSVRVRIISSRSSKEIFNTIKTLTIEESNVRVGENVDSERYLLSQPNLLEKLIKEAFVEYIPQIIETMERMRWEGRIAMISGDRIFLNVGSLSGLQLNDILKVSESGEEVYDPQTGNYIGQVPGKTKGTLEVISFFGQDGSIAVIHSGAGFKENDRVELY